MHLRLLWITRIGYKIPCYHDYNHAFSYKYTIYIKPTKPGEGGIAEPGLVVNDLKSYLTTATVVVGGLATFYFWGSAVSLLESVFAKVVGEIVGITELIK